MLEDEDATELKAALQALTESTTGGLTSLKTALKGLTDRVSDIEVKAKRPRLGTTEAKDGDLRAEHKALGIFARTGNDEELKTLSVGVDPSGGYFVTPAMATTMITRIRDLSPMRRLATVISIGAGDAWETPVDLNDVGASWIGETAARPETTNPTPVGVLRVPLNEIYAHQAITQRLIDDASFDVGAWIEEKISDKFGRAEGTACVSGDGENKPRGIVTYDTDVAVDGVRDPTKLQHVVSGHATQITADGLRDLYWSLRAPHRAVASFLCSSSTANAIDKLKDGQGNYLWRDSSAAGVPPTLLGRPVEFSEDMPAVGAGTLPIAFGDFKSGYAIVDRPGIKWLRDPFTSKPNVITYAYRRTGGAVTLTDAIKVLKVSA